MWGDLQRKRQTRTPFQTLAHTAALVVANVSVASGAALTLKPSTEFRELINRFATENGWGATGYHWLPDVRANIKKTQSHLLQTDEKHPSFFRTQMDGHYFLLCTAPSSGTLRERGISPQPLRQPITGGLGVPPVLWLAIFRSSPAPFGRFRCP